MKIALSILMTCLNLSAFGQWVNGPFQVGTTSNNFAVGTDGTVTITNGSANLNINLQQPFGGSSLSINAAIGGVATWQLQFKSNTWSIVNAQSALSQALSINTNDTVTVASNLVVNGSITGSGQGLTTNYNGVNTASQIINATGVTNLSNHYGTAVVQATASTFTNWNSAGQMVITNTGLTGTYTFPLGPGAYITAHTGLAGFLIFQ